MNKALKSLAIAAVVFGFAALSADDTTGKTTLLPRSHGVNLAMEYTTFNDLIDRKDDDKFGANFQVVGFYKDSTNETDLGKYFGVSNKNVFVIGDNNGDIPVNYIIHNNNNAQEHFDEGTIKWEPDQTAYGVRIDYCQDLEKVLDGLYFKVCVPIVHVENDMQMVITKGSNAAALGDVHLPLYFKGTFTPADGAADANAQAQLTHAKIDGDQDSTGIADIDFILGYKVLNEEDYHLAINVGVTIPTGDDPDGIWKWEPVVGNGDHWGLGGGIEFAGRVWEDEDQAIKLSLVGNYRYLFESKEKRTLGLKGFADVNGDAIAGAREYTLIGKAGETSATPAANILTKNVDVEPGSQLDAIFNVCYVNGNFSFDLGYNLFWKDDEDVDFVWTDDEASYGIIARDHDMSTAGGLNTNQAVHWAGADYAASQLTKERIDGSVAETPSYVTHKVYGGVGYTFKDWDNPIFFGIGGSYEFASDNQEVEGWGAWFKFGFGI